MVHLVQPGKLLLLRRSASATGFWRIDQCPCFPQTPLNLPRSKMLQLISVREWCIFHISRPRQPEQITLLPPSPID